MKAEQERLWGPLAGMGKLRFQPLLGDHTRTSGSVFGMAVELGRDWEAAAYLAAFQGLQKAAEKLWCRCEHFYFDCLGEPGKEKRWVRSRSFSGLIPLLAVCPSRSSCSRACRSPPVCWATSIQ
ncbi:MAG: hypothetical protein KIS61_34605 [Candidatus Eremiobacteraeota bacterium]|nr:hypothetical protein [Candidatus Eremiobacteraeota bacterium]